MLVCEVPSNVFQDKVMEEESCHLQVIDSDVPRWVGGGDEPCSDVIRPFDTPHCWVEVVFATEPDPTGSPFAGVTVANKVGPSRDKLGTFGWTICYHLEDDG